MTLMNREYWIIRFSTVSNEFQILHQPESIERGGGLQYEDKKLGVSISSSFFPDIEYRHNNYIDFYIQGDNRNRNSRWVSFRVKDFGRLFKTMENLGPIKTENGRIRLDV